MRWVALPVVNWACSNLSKRATSKLQRVVRVGYSRRQRVPMYHLTHTGNVRRQGQSTLLIAGVAALASTVGGLTLTQATNFSQELAATETGGALDALDDSTRVLLQAAVVLIGITAGLAGTRAAFKAMTDSVTENALNLAKVTVFWVVVFLAARFVLQS